MLRHLAELRKRLIVAVVAVACGAVVCWIFYPWIIESLMSPYCEVVDPTAEGLDAGGECRLLVLDPLEPLAVRMTVAGYGGLILAAPVLLWQALRFIGPGLRKQELRLTLAFVTAGVLLFAAGVALAIWSIPRALGFLTSIGGEDLVSFFSPRRYLGFVIKMAVAFGIGFEFPVLLVFAQFAGLVSTAKLRRTRQWALLGIVIAGAVLTPSGDPLTLLILSGPMYLFYEMAILLGALRQRRKARLEEREGGEQPDAGPPVAGQSSEDQATEDQASEDQAADERPGTAEG